MTALTAGTKAPSFSLSSKSDQIVSLSDFKGKPVVLVFYPADWSPTCSDELTLFNESLSELKKYNAEVICISVDNIWCHTAFIEAKKIRLILLADFEPKGAVAKAYGVYREKEGTAQRALFVIDEGGVIRWSYVSPASVNPGVDGVIEALENLQQQTLSNKK